ncbi:MAG TPA: methyltransferase domain-containing protein [Dongiaceae bacterium]|jgi:SAM-dependent methyltransferase|nr:methyltransferase domain-containing protein [Dongiaceae bacterium]
MIPRIFDAALGRRRHDRALRQGRVDFLAREIGARLLDRLDDIARAFPRAGDLSAFPGLLASLDGGKVGDWTDLGIAVASDQVELLTGTDRPFDLILSNLTLHRVNDLPGMLAQIRQALRPDGLFLGAFVGGETLRELRDCLAQAEEEILGGFSPRVAPMIPLLDAAHLLARAGFALPVADSETITITYGDFFSLLRELRLMGESTALTERLRRFTPRRLFDRAGEIYARKYADEGGRLSVTCEVIFIAGWAPDQSQQKPARRGSADLPLSAALALSSARRRGK